MIITHKSRLMKDKSMERELEKKNSKYSCIQGVTLNEDGACAYIKL